MPKIFISYRRDDSLLHAGRIFDQLALRFNPKDIFIDFTIPTGGDFPQILRDAVEQCDVCLVIIGKQWGDMMHQRTQKNADDWVRFELRMALERHAKKECVVMPVLAGGATMPDVKFVPDDIRKLLDLNALSVRDAQRDFHNDIAQLVADIHAVAGISAPKNLPPAPPPFTKIDAFATFKAFEQARNTGKRDEARQLLAQLRSTDNLPATIASVLDEDEKDLRDGRWIWIGAMIGNLIVTVFFMLFVGFLGFALGPTGAWMTIPINIFIGFSMTRATIKININNNNSKRNVIIILSVFWLVIAFLSSILTWMSWQANTELWIEHRIDDTGTESFIRIFAGIVITSVICSIGLFIPINNKIAGQLPSTSSIAFSSSTEQSPANPIVASNLTASGEAITFSPDKTLESGLQKLDDLKSKGLIDDSE